MTHLKGFQKQPLVGRTMVGWTQVFCNWPQNVFVPSINERQVKKPVLLLIDGHKTHVTMQASDICIENGVELYCLLEHASHIMQPLDLRLFSSLKRTWRQAVRNWQSEHIGEFVTKRTFARVFKQAWNTSTTVEVAVKGFNEAGLFPLDPTAFLCSVKLDPSMLFSQNSSSESKIPPKEAAQLLPSGDSVFITPNVSTGNQASKEIDKTTDQTDQHDVETTAIVEANSSNSDDKDKENDSVLDTVPKMVVTPAKDPHAVEGSNQTSPFSKFLKYPESKPSTSKKRSSQSTMPKAITKAMYQAIQQEKLKAKEEFEQAKKQCQEEREKKRQQREEECERKRIEREERRNQKKREYREKKATREMRERLLKSLADGSDSNDAMDVGIGNCYDCERPYGSDYLQCFNCNRRFHLACASGQMKE